MTAHRTVHLPTGERQIQKYVGKRPDLSDSERPEVWETVATVAADAVWSGHVRASADISVGAIAGAVVLSIGSVRHAIPVEQVEQALSEIGNACDEAKRLRSAEAPPA